MFVCTRPARATSGMAVCRTYRKRGYTRGKRKLLYACTCSHFAGWPNDRWMPDGDWNGRPGWRRSGNKDDKLRWDGADVGWTLKGDDGNIVYSCSKDALMPPQLGWEVSIVEGVSNAPVPTFRFENECEKQRLRFLWEARTCAELVGNIDLSSVEEYLKAWCRRATPEMWQAGRDEKFEHFDGIHHLIVKRVLAKDLDLADISVEDPEAISSDQELLKTRIKDASPFLRQLFSFDGKLECPGWDNRPSQYSRNVHLEGLWDDMVNDKGEKKQEWTVYWGKIGDGGRTWDDYQAYAKKEQPGGRLLTVSELRQLLKQLVRPSPSPSLHPCL